jgi:hypothetical protein
MIIPEITKLFSKLLAAGRLAFGQIAKIGINKNTSQQQPRPGDFLNNAIANASKNQNVTSIDKADQISEQADHERTVSLLKALSENHSPFAFDSSSDDTLLVDEWNPSPAFALSAEAMIASFNSEEVIRAPNLNQPDLNQIDKNGIDSVLSLTKQRSNRNASKSSNNLPPAKRDLFNRGGESSEDELEFIKLIARKANTPLRRLVELAKHPDKDVRTFVAGNANAPIETMWQLAKDPIAEVKVRLANNYNCPLEIIETLQEDIDLYVSWQAKCILSKITGHTCPDVGLEDAPQLSPKLVHSR